MPHVGTQHPNASLTPRGRRKMVRLVIDHGWTIEAAADEFHSALDDRTRIVYS